MQMIELQPAIKIDSIIQRSPFTELRKRPTKDKPECTKMSEVAIQ
jgi:hypothetical protein